jgi:splicing factor 3A subunit 1
MNQEEVYAPGTSIESSLKNLAERRTDIFGSGDVETAIGQKIGEEEVQRKPEKPTWDGYSTSAESVSRQARAGVTIEEQIQQIHKIKGLVPEKDRIGPASTPMHSMPNQHSGYNNPMSSLPRPPMHHHQQQHQHPSMSMVNTMNQHNMPHGMQQGHMMNAPGAPMMPQGGQPFMMTPQSMMMAGMYGMMPPDMSGMHAMGMPPGLLPPVAEDEPSSKKQKTEDNLIPEDEYIAANPEPVNVQIVVPQVPDKPEWQLNGQTINLTLPLTETFGGLKNRIQEKLTIPIGKQKLQYEGMFVKDSNTLAFYNLPAGASVVLGLKERGVRKQ